VSCGCDSGGPRLVVEHSYLAEDLENGGSSRFDAHRLVLAGRVLHLVKRGTKKRRCCHSCRRCSLCSTRRVYEVSSSRCVYSPCPRPSTAVARWRRW